MRIVRFLKDKVRYGLVDNNIIRTIKDFPSPDFELDSGEFLLEDVRLLSPCEPSKIVALGLNYYDHARELGMMVPNEPLLFLKPPSAVIGPEEAIIIPPQSKRVDYEAELAIVIGRKAKKVPVERVFDYILGYTCFNDVTARDLQERDVQWTRAKGFDTFAPMGPWIETELDISDVRLEAYINGSKRQSSSTSQLIFSVPEIVSYVSHIMTLFPGDVIATGTPPGVGPLNVGDIVEVFIEGIGRLKNYVKAA